MWIHRQRLARGDAEELGVEVAGLLNETPLAGIARAGVVGIGVVEALEVPAAVVGKLNDAVAARSDELPELLR